MVKLLLQRGDIEANRPDVYGQTPLRSAARKGYLTYGNWETEALRANQHCYEARESDSGPHLGMRFAIGGVVEKN